MTNKLLLFFVDSLDYSIYLAYISLQTPSLDQTKIPTN